MVAWLTERKNEKLLKIHRNYKLTVPVLDIP
jgi:hypothetical protein